MGCGVAALVMTITTSQSLRSTLEAIYERQGFADLFVHLKRAPRSLLERIGQVPGVALAEGRIVVDVTLDAPGVLEPALGRMVSIPDRGEPGLHRLHVRAGRLPEPGRAGEVAVNEAFAEALGLRPGDSIPAVVTGRRDDLRIVGVALSPEFVYALRPGGFVPDDRRFGVLWMREEELAGLHGMDGAFNDLLLRLERGANEQAVIEAIDALVAPYGGTMTHGRHDQASHRAIDDEMQQLANMGRVTPTVFLAVSALLLNIVLARLVHTQREQIAILKAFGYGRWAIAWHYMGFVLAVACVGAALGVAGGVALAWALTGLYQRFFRFPELEFVIEPSVVGIGLLVTIGAASLGTLTTVRTAMRLPPAEAMRPEAPPDYRATIVERSGVLSRIGPVPRMIVRHIERRPWRALVSTLGLALAMGVFALGNYIEDAVAFLVEFQFEAAERYDISTTFVEPRAERAVRELGSIAGVLEAEPFRAVPVRLRHDQRSERQTLLGIPGSPRLSRPLDENAKLIAPPPEGLVLSSTLADLLGVVPGDSVTVEVQEGQRPVFELTVAALAETYIGTAAYMDLAAMRRLLREGDVASGAYLTIDRLRLSEAYRRLKDTPGVATTVVRRASLESFQRTLAQNLLTMRLFNVGFACVIAVGIVYNSARIALAERSHELATLRVLGFQRSEVAAIFLGELALLVLAAVPLGLLVGAGFCAIATSSMATETHRIPYVLSPRNLALSVAVVLSAAAVTGWTTRRRLDRLDLLAVLKAAS